MSNIPSLTKPPQAPKKKKASLAERRGRLDQIRRRLVFEENQPRKPEWRVLAESGEVRAKFLRYNPDDVAEIDDLDFLDKLRDWYFPSSQPHNAYEFAYCELMREAVDNRQYVL